MDSSVPRTPRATSKGLAQLTGEGSHGGQFASMDWTLLGAISLIWGSSFLWIAVGLESLHPGAIALLRLLLGAAILAVLPGRRRTSVDHRWWPQIAAIGVVGNAAPALLFAFAEQRVESSVAGMMNSISPLLIVGISLIMTRRAPQSLQILGLTIGLGGALAISIPNLVGAQAQPLGVLLVFGAVMGYSIANNLMPPLQQAYGGPAVIFRALLVASVLMAPYGLYGLTRSRFSWSAAIAMVILGVFGTGIARSFMATLIGRVGPTRSSLVGYLVPVVAIVLGVGIRDESLAALELVGTGLILVGAFVVSRAPTNSQRSKLQLRENKPNPT